jgi:hypothetical protein
MSEGIESTTTQDEAVAHASALFGTWQPIETAPKDFTPVLLVWHWDSGVTGGTSVILARWKCRKHSHCGVRHDCPNEAGCQMGWDNYAGEFTHWMPLPSVPSVPNAGESKPATNESEAVALHRTCSAPIAQAMLRYWDIAAELKD